MMTIFSLHRCGRPQRAFTLVELLVVMGIMGLLLYLVVPISATLQQSSNLSFAGQAVADKISVARELAASRNNVVEVRFTSLSGGTGSAIATGYRTVQLWAPNSQGTSVPVGQVLILPDSIEISSNAALSPLLATLCAGSGGTIASGPEAGKYVSFFIRPSGSVEVTAPPANSSGSGEDVADKRAPSYFFTILHVRYDQNSTVPPNYFTLQINPDTGRTEAYRP